MCYWPRTVTRVQPLEKYLRLTITLSSMQLYHWAGIHHRFIVYKSVLSCYNYNTVTALNQHSRQNLPCIFGQFNFNSIRIRRCFLAQCVVSCMCTLKGLFIFQLLNYSTCVLDPSHLRGSLLFWAFRGSFLFWGSLIFFEDLSFLELCEDLSFFELRVRV